MQTKRMQKAQQAIPKLKVLDKPKGNALDHYLATLLQTRARAYAIRQKGDDGGEGGVGGGSAVAVTAPKVKANQVAPEPTAA